MITKQTFEEAPPFTVFEGAKPVAKPDPHVPCLWGVFSGGPGYSKGVADALALLGLDVGDRHIERDDQTANAVQEGVDGSPEYDDFDAAIDALNSGITLVKVPDALSGPDAKYFYMYVLEKP